GGPYSDLAVDDTGRLYALNIGGHVVEVYGPDFAPITTCSSAEIAQGSALSQQGGRLWITETNGNLIRKWGLQGNRLESIGSFGSAHGQFDHPYKTTFDPDGNLLVSDPGNLRIEKFSVAQLRTTPTPTVVPSILTIASFTADPNPFNPNLTTTTLSYQLSQNAAIHLTIQDVHGTLLFQQDYSSGSVGGRSGLDQVVWNGFYNGSSVGPGDCLVSISANGSQVSAQMHLNISNGSNFTPATAPTRTPTPLMTTSATFTSTNTPLPTSTPTETAQIPPTSTTTPMPLTATETSVPPTATE